MPTVNINMGNVQQAGRSTDRPGPSSSRTESEMSGEMPPLATDEEEVIDDRYRYTKDEQLK